MRPTQASKINGIVSLGPYRMFDRYLTTRFCLYCLSVQIGQSVHVQLMWMTLIQKFKTEPSAVAQ